MTIKSSPELKQDYLDLLLRIALTESVERDVERICEEIEADKAAGNTAEMDAFFARTEKRTLRLIGREVRNMQIKRFAHNTLPQLGRVAAILLLVFFIGLTTAIATVRSVRVKVLELLVNVEEQYTELSLRENVDASFIVPIEWQGDFYLSYIPEGFVLDEVDSYAMEHSVSFYNGEGASISFSELSESAATNIDTEDASVRSILIGTSTALLVEKGGNVTIAWAVQDKYFVLILFEGDVQSAVEVAEKVVRIT